MTVGKCNFRRILIRSIVLGRDPSDAELAVVTLHQHRGGSDAQARASRQEKEELLQAGQVGTWSAGRFGGGRISEKPVDDHPVLRQRDLADQANLLLLTKCRSL